MPAPFFDFQMPVCNQLQINHFNGFFVFNFDLVSASIARICIISPKRFNSNAQTTDLHRVPSPQELQHPTGCVGQPCPNTNRFETCFGNIFEQTYGTAITATTETMLPNAGWIHLAFRVVGGWGGTILPPETTTPLPWQSGKTMRRDSVHFNINTFDFCGWHFTLALNQICCGIVTITAVATSVQLRTPSPVTTPNSVTLSLATNLRTHFAPNFNSQRCRHDQSNHKTNH